MENCLFPAFIFGETIFGGSTLLFEDDECFVFSPLLERDQALYRG